MTRDKKFGEVREIHEKKNQGEFESVVHVCNEKYFELLLNSRVPICLTFFMPFVHFFTIPEYGGQSNQTKLYQSQWRCTNRWYKFAFCCNRFSQLPEP